MSQAVSSSARSRFRSVALPVEHGGWGFLLEPILAGLLIAPTVAGLSLGIAALGAFLIHQPLKTALKDQLKGRTYERTRWAMRFAAGYGVMALAGLLLALWQANAPFVLPLLLALPLAGVQLAFEARNRGRDLLPEAAGALALGATGAAILMAAGWPSTTALLLWALLGLRTLPALLYVRARLRGQRGEHDLRMPALLWHVAALVIVLALVAAGMVAWPAAVGALIMLARTAHGLWVADPATRAPVIGMWEMIYGVIYALLAAGAVLM